MLARTHVFMDARAGLRDESYVGGGLGAQRETILQGDKERERETSVWPR